MRRWIAIAALACGACGGGDKHAAKPAEKQAAAKPVAVRPSLVTPTTLSPDVVLAKIRSAYLGGMKRCYSVALKTRQSARGKVMISFTVDAQGRAQSGDARGFADRVDACLEAQMADWRFPVPKDASGAPTEASFALPLELEAD